MHKLMFLSFLIFTAEGKVEEANVIGILRHTLESGRMRLDLPLTRLGDDDDVAEEDSEA